MNVKPIIVFEGLDKVGKSSLAELTAEKYHMYLDCFPTRRLPWLRELAKSQELKTIPGFPVTPLSSQSRMLAHALSHSLCFDGYRESLKTNAFEGIVLDRYWYSNIAYAITYEDLDPSYIAEVEMNAKPPMPDIVFHVFTEENIPLVTTENTHLERLSFRNQIAFAYTKFLKNQSEMFGLKVFDILNRPGKFDVAFGEVCKCIDFLLEDRGIR